MSAKLRNGDLRDAVLNGWLSEMKTALYQTARGESLKDLDVLVNRLIAEGWQPYGSPFHTESPAEGHPANWACQAMTLDSETFEQRKKDNETAWRHEEVDEQLVESLSQLLLGEQLRFDIESSQTGETIIPAKRKITMTLVRKLSGASGGGLRMRCASARDLAYAICR